MDLGTVITGTILITICILPFILMGRTRKKIEKQLLQSLTNIANQQNAQLSQHEICGDFAIGIDETKNVVLFFKAAKNKAIEAFIDLADIQNCTVQNTGRTIVNNDGDQQVIDKLELSFTPISSNKTGIVWEFFNIYHGIQLSGELQTAEKWSKLINNHLKIKK